MFRRFAAFSAVYVLLAPAPVCRAQMPAAGCGCGSYAIGSPNLYSAAPASQPAAPWAGNSGFPALSTFSPAPGLPSLPPGNLYAPQSGVGAPFAGNCCSGSAAPLLGTAAGAYSQGYDGCAPCATACAPRGLYGAAEFLWMRAHFDQNVAMIIDPPVGNTMVPFDYDFQFTPRAWLGWQSACGGGVRATYWRYDEAAARETATAVVGATPVYLFVYGAGDNLTRNAYADLGETLTSTHQLKLQALDLEWTESFCLRSWNAVGGAGLRLAEMNQNMRGEIYIAGNVLQEVVTNDLGFQGVGPTVSLQLRRPLHASGFSLYSAVRGSMLLSETTQSIYEMKDAGANIVLDVANQQEVLTAGELAVGIQFQRCLNSGASFFVRSNYECQAWFDVGGPVDSTSTVSLDGVSLATGLLF